MLKSSPVLLDALAVFVGTLGFCLISWAMSAYADPRWSAEPEPVPVSALRATIDYRGEAG